MLQRIAGSPVPRGTLRAAARIRGGQELGSEVFDIGKRLRYSPDASFVYERSGCTPVRLRLAGAALSLYYLDDYEPSTMRPVVALARSARGFLDIGAQTGVFTFVVASANPDLCVVAFEANPASLEVLLDNVRLNEGRVGLGRVSVCQAAVSDSRGTAQFNLAGGNSSLNPAFRAGSRPLLCQTVSIDAFLEERGEEMPVDLVKIDTESTEPAVLRGMEATIARHRPVIVVEVLRGRTEDELNRFVEVHDYRTLSLVDPAPRLVDRIAGDGTHHDLNFLLVPAEKLDAVVAITGASTS